MEGRNREGRRGKERFIHIYLQGVYYGEFVATTRTTIHICMGQPTDARALMLDDLYILSVKVQWFELSLTRILYIRCSKIDKQVDNPNPERKVFDNFVLGRTVHEILIN